MLNRNRRRYVFSTHRLLFYVIDIHGVISVDNSAGCWTIRRNRGKVSRVLRCLVSLNQNLEAELLTRTGGYNGWNPTYQETREIRTFEIGSMMVRFTKPNRISLMAREESWRVECIRGDFDQVVFLYVFA